jgi:hypothetical protein
MTAIKNAGMGYVTPGLYYQPAPFCYDDDVPAGVILAGAASEQGQHMLAKELIADCQGWLADQLTLNPDYVGASPLTVARWIAATESRIA